MSSYCDYDQPEFYNETHPIARKDHKCIECNKPIRSKTKYARCVGKFDGALYSISQHMECRDFAAKVNIEYIGNCAIPFGGIDDMEEWLDMAGVRPDLVEDLKKEWRVIRSMER